MEETFDDQAVMDAVEKLKMSGDVAVIHIRKTWDDVVKGEEEDEKLNFDYVVPRFQKEYFEAEILRAFENWMMEECEGSILISEDCSADDLCSVPIGDYIHAWMEERKVPFVEITQSYEKTLYKVAQRFADDHITAEHRIEQSPRVLSKLTDYLYTKLEAHDFWENDDTFQYLNVKAHQKCNAEMKKELMPVLKTFYDEYKTMKDEIQRGFLNEKQLAFIVEKLDLKNLKDEELSPLWFAVDDFTHDLMFDRETGYWKPDIGFEADTDSALKEVINMQARERREKKIWTLDSPAPSAHKKKKSL